MEIEAEKGTADQGIGTARRIQKSRCKTRALPRLELEAQLKTAQQALEQAEEALNQRKELDVELQFARQRQADARAENPRLKAEMDRAESARGQAL